MTDWREMQLCETDILCQVVAFCEKHGLRYYLSSGTLLGAVRHKGFIPWDNDIDIEMPIEDYRRFLKLAQKSFPSGLFVQTYNTDKEFNELWCQIRKNNTTSLPIKLMKWKLHWGMHIDIFPLFGEYRNSVLAKLQRKLFVVCRTLLAKDYDMAVQPESVAGNWKLQLIYLLPRWFRHASVNLMTRFVFKRFDGSEQLLLGFCRLRQSFPRKWFLPSAVLEFEGNQFVCPGNYDGMLSHWYGDYMTPPPESERNGHEGSLGKIIYDLHRDYREYLHEYEKL